MGRVNKRPLHLSIKRNDKLTVYLIDDFSSLNVMWQELYNEFLISFKQYGKPLLVSTKWFNISGKVYADL